MLLDVPMNGSWVGLVIGFHVSVILLIAFLIVYTLILRKRFAYQTEKSFELDREKNRLLLIKESFTASPIPSIIISSNNFMIEMANEAFLSMSGYTREELVAEKKVDLIELTADKTLKNLAMSAKTMASNVKQTFELITKHGSIRTVEASFQSIAIMGDDYVLVVMNDITIQTLTKKQEIIEDGLRQVIINARMTCNTIEGFCDSVLPKVTESLGFTTGLIRFFDSESNTLVRMGTYNYTEVIKGDIDDIVDVNEKENICSAVAKTRKPMICGNVATDPIIETFTAAILYNHIGSVATYPLISSTNQLLGTFCMWSEDSIDRLDEWKWMISRIMSLISTGIEQMQADEEITSTQARYISLFENANDAVLFHDLDGNITDANPSAIKLLGYSAVEMIDKMSIFDIILDSTDRISNGLLTRLNANDTVQFNETFVSKDGENIFAEVSSSLVYIFEKPVIIAIIHDVTQTRLFQKKLKESEEQYRHLYETATAGLFKIEMEEGMLLSVNRQGAKLAGYNSIEDIPSEGFKMSNRIERSTLNTIKKLLRLEGELHDVEVIWSSEDGSHRYFLTSLKYYESKGYIEGSFIDITDRKLVESALVTSEEKLRSIIDKSPIGIHIFELVDGRLCLSGVNFSSREIIGDDYTCTIGDDISSIYPYSTKPSLQEALSNVVETERGFHDELELHESGDKRIDRIFEYWAFKSYEGNLVVEFRDITQERKAELEKAHMTKLISDKNRELEQLLYVTSHDLRSPLVNIIGFGSELEDDIVQLLGSIDNSNNLVTVRKHIETFGGERLFESIRFIQASARKIDILLKNLLKLSRIGRKRIDIQEINTEELISVILDTLQFQIQSAGATIEVSSLPLCWADLDQLNQVFTNIIENAIKYRKPDEPCVIRVSGNEDNSNCIYRVSDNGVGIKKEHQDKVFQLFHQLNPTKGSGYGMGMSIAKRIVTKHNGKVWIESEEDKGTSVFISLPKKRGEFSEYQ
jgi:PAS domain S-box-containing protein